MYILIPHPPPSPMHTHALVSPSTAEFCIEALVITGHAFSFSHSEKELLVMR